MFIRRGEGTLEERVEKVIGKSKDSDVFTKLIWLGLFEETPIKMLNGTSAQFLEQIIMPKWQLNNGDRDAIYMAHVCYYTKGNKTFKRKSYLAVEGEETERTAMAKTVGLPLAAAVKQVASGNFTEPGLHIPTSQTLYSPILKDLESNGIRFNESEEEVKEQD